MSITVEVIKFDTKKLDDLCNRYNTTIDRALGAFAEQIMGVAITLAPVDTGNLRNSIKVKHPAMNHWLVTDGMNYGIYWEYGFHPWGRGSLHQKPFFRPAIEQALNSGYLYNCVREWTHKDFGV